MAGAGYKLFNTGDVLTAAQVNTYLQEQTVMVFASSTARTTALSGVLAEGMVSYLQDTNAVEVYNGSAWVGVSGAGDVTEVQAGTGISVASGTGPIPVVTNTMATAFDAKGDLIGGTGADTFAKLTVGANNTVLTADSSTATGLKWAAAAAPSFVGVSVNAAASFTQQTITNNTATALNMASEYFDTDAFHDNSTNNTRLTVPSGKGGKYFIRANAEWASNATGQRSFRFYKNGALLAFTQQPAVTGSYGMQLHYVLDLVAGDYIEWYVLQSSGGNLDIYFSPDATAFTMYYLGA